ncbi:ferredoxin--NADP+ reductase subunit alpha [Clostridium sp. CAG:349]|nr:ferredoxin--NADP+ reductase subunit alpha [Clostridium sp. CAG:349]
MKTYEIISKKQFSEKVNEYVVYAPDVAHRVRAGQFIILRATEDGERVPFTVCDYDREKGTITILVQTVGYSTMILEKLLVGDTICDFVGPLGKPTDLSGFDKILLVGGGIGSAVVYPQAKQLMLENKAADVIVGARNENLIIYENDFKKFSNEFFIMTDDGSAGEKGFVTDKIKNLLDEGRKYDCIFAVGPLPMMKAVCALTKNYGVKTIVSMNTIMVDGTGMCGSCRLTVDGKVKYACVDGPEFDGHLVDFDEAINRSKFYKGQEKEHVCRLTGGIR